jgi:arylsulfatase A-like enzyme
MRKHIVKQIILLSVVLFYSLILLGCGQATESQTTRPNILFILVDDLGKEWISAYGADNIKTPNVDQLAATGMQFSNAYVMPQCTPTRLSFLTGQYPYRHGWVNHWDVPRWGGGAHYDWNRNPCISMVMKEAGYKSAIAGKWQITDFRVQPEAMTEIGFDDYCMWTGGEGDNPPSDERYWDPYIHTKEGSKIWDGTYGETVFTDFLIDFMKKNKDEPMFLYYPMVLTHVPLVTTPDEPDVTTDLDKHKAMVRYTDKVLGRLVQALEELNIRDNTIIVWTTDNGTDTSITGHQNGRTVVGAKAKSTEPGLCVPFIVNAPGLVPEGVKTDALVDVTDFLPTFAELGGGKLQEGYTYDGKSFADHILGKSEDSNRSWILGMGGRNEAKLTEDGVENAFVFRDRVIREKRFKLYVSPQRQPEKLVDVLADPAEEKNLIGSSDPEALAALTRMSAIIPSFPARDNDPIYTPNPDQPWDVEITAKSEVWKK